MNLKDLEELICDIVAQAQKLSDKHTTERNAPVNYVCIFSQNEIEYQSFLKLASQLGSSVKETAMGPVFHIKPFTTIAGELDLIKIRRPDPKRLERGDADFTVRDYPSFRERHIGKHGFSLIERKEMEMIELIDPVFNTIAYYSYPTLHEVLKLEH